jgi:hypothetical protein
MRTITMLAINMRTVTASIVEMIAVDAEGVADTAKTVVAAAMSSVVAIVRIAAATAALEEVEMLEATQLTASSSRTATISILTLWARRSLHSNSKFICSSRARRTIEMTRRAREAHQRFAI